MQKFDRKTSHKGDGKITLRWAWWKFGVGWDMEETDSGSCKISTFGISGIKSLCSACSESIILVNLQFQISTWLEKLFQIW
jgi:hypothetical protein